MPDSLIPVCPTSQPSPGSRHRLSYGHWERPGKEQEDTWCWAVCEVLLGRDARGAAAVGQLHAGMKGESWVWGWGDELGLLSPHTAGPGGFLEPFERRGQRGSPGRNMGALGRG